MAAETWEFCHKEGWKEIEFPFPHTEEQGKNWDEFLSDLGYVPEVQFVDEWEFCYVYYDYHGKTEFPYFCEFMFSEMTCARIFCRNFPSFAMFLGTITPYVTAYMLHSMMGSCKSRLQDEYVRSEERRRSGVQPKVRNL